MCLRWTRILEIRLIESSAFFAKPLIFVIFERKHRYCGAMAPPIQSRQHQRQISRTAKTRISHATYPSSYYVASANSAPERDATQLRRDRRLRERCRYAALSTALSLLEHGFPCRCIGSGQARARRLWALRRTIVNCYSSDIDTVERSTGNHDATLIGPMAFEGVHIIR